MSYSALIVGLGQIGMGYDLHLDPAAHVYSHARAFNQHDSFSLTAGVEPGAEQRKVFEDTYHCPAYADIDSALARHQPDVVAIAVPTPMHGASLRRVLAAAKPRAILCEKPLSYHIEEARAMVADCAAHDVQLFVNYPRRCDIGVVEIRRRLDAGEIAGPVKGVCWYSKGFQHNGSHFFNLLEFWLGPVRETSVIDAGRLWDGADPEPDVRVHFERGSIVFMAAREEAFSHYTIELVAANGRLRYEQGGKRIEWQAAQPNARIKGYTVLAPEAELIANGMDKYQLHVTQQLANALAGREHHLCTGAEALATLEHLQKIIAQRERGMDSNRGTR